MCCRRPTDVLFPSARNMQEIDVYVALAEGLYLYNAKSNALKKINSEDLTGHNRQATFRQGRAGQFDIRSGLFTCKKRQNR